jgi:hypothetical protein
LGSATTRVLLGNGLYDFNTDGQLKLNYASLPTFTSSAIGYNKVDIINLENICGNPPATTFSIADTISALLIGVYNFQISFFVYFSKLQVVQFSNMVLLLLQPQ